MAMYPAIIEAAGIALFLTILFGVLGTCGPWDSLWTLFLVLFLAMLATSLYMDPVGPVFLGIVWLPLVLPGVLFALLLLAVTPVEGHKRLKHSKVRNLSRSIHQSSHANPRIIIGTPIGRFFWLVIMIFTLAVIVGLGV